jgi:glycerol uptake facilitator-like aquaporin
MDSIAARRTSVCVATALLITFGVGRVAAASLRGGKNFEIGTISCSHN